MCIDSHVLKLGHLLEMSGQPHITTELHQKENPQVNIDYEAGRVPDLVTAKRNEVKSCPCLDSNSDHWAIQPIAIRCIYCPIAALVSTEYSTIV
jgi:hypothetical protein